MPTSSNDIAISVRGLGKTYRIQHKVTQFTAIEALLHRMRNPFEPPPSEEVKVLQDISFDIARGDVVGIIGRNGAGKSTLFKILSRIVEPTYGEARIYGRIASLIEVGTGFQPELTGRENVYLNGAILGMRRREITQRFDEIVEFSGVEKFLDTPVKRYSSGMYVRLAFSVAAHLDADILLIDEVLSVGDAEFQKKSLGKMTEIARAGRTVVFVSHNLATLEALCTKGIVLEGGHIAQQGPLKEALVEYNRIVHTRPTLLAASADVMDAFKSKYKYFRGLDLLDENGEPTRSVAMGSAVKVRFVIETDRVIDNPSVKVAFENFLGSRALASNSPKIGASSLIAPGVCELTCDFGMLPLAPGDYGIILLIKSGIDILEQTAVELQFTVRDFDTFGDGWGFGGGTSVTPADWTMKRIGAVPAAS